MAVFEKALAPFRQNESIMTAGTGITAHAGGGQANATLLSDGVNEVNTVASAADSVLLPVAVAGTVRYVANQGANSMQVFGQASTSDTINNVATGTGVAVANGKNAVFFCTHTSNSSLSIPGEWYMILSA